EAKDDGEASKDASAKLIAAIEQANVECGSCGCEFDPRYKQALAMKDLFVKKSMWIFGGDGWSYDIGFGGLDHVLASGEDVNVFVFDTEVYSNTGGQASKSTPTGSVAQFAAAGKTTKKKDLAAIAMSYGYVYVAQVAMGSDYNQCVKAISEAESYHGPSLVIGYAPCINHGIKKGLGTSMLETKAAVAAGYWHTFRFNPIAAEEGKNPFTLDSKEPSTDYKEFINSESRYSSLNLFFPERAKVLFERAEQEAKAKYLKLKTLADGQ
ncbi:MAG: thiamine pyrophosphate-dependent enzyme, partial [Eubacteriales bacterium]|nr:thiamine pyrophosphate-dependent enzyme [Eubacteriales bacterium]